MGHALIELCLCTCCEMSLHIEISPIGHLSQVVQRFQELFSQAKYKEAAELAAESPQGLLRTPDTVAKFQVVFSEKVLIIAVFHFFNL